MNLHQSQAIALFRLGLILSTTLGGVAAAQSPTVLPPAPPSISTIDGFGVDLTSGTIANPPLQSVSIGNKGGGLSAGHHSGAVLNHIAYLTIERVAIYNGGFMVARVVQGGSAHLFNLGTISKTNYPPPGAPNGTLFVWTFTPQNGVLDTFPDFNDDGATLVCTGSIYNLFQGGTCSIHKGAGGSVTQFRMPSVSYSDNLLNRKSYDTVSHRAYAWPTKVILSDGEELSYNYVNYAETDHAGGGNPAATILNSIDSSLGFRVYISPNNPNNYTFPGNPTGASNPGVMIPPSIWMPASGTDITTSNLYAINTSLEYEDPLTLNRSFGPASVSSVATHGTSSSFSLFNNGVKVATVESSASPSIALSIVSPGGVRTTYNNMASFGPFRTSNEWYNDGSLSWMAATPEGAFPYKLFSVTKNVTASYQVYVEGRSAGYFPERYRVVATNPDGSVETSIVRYGLLQSRTDGLGRTTTYGYSGQDGYFAGIPGYARLTRPSGVGLPNGTSQIFSYTHGAISSSTVTPLGGTALVTQVGLASGCTAQNYRVCNKPTYIRDPKGNQTDFTYDPAHGGVLTETLPADANGVRPQKRFNYSQLYPKVLNASAQLVNSTPVWRLTRVSECLTASASDPASCVGTAQERVTTYAYNHNNLFLTSETVAAGDGSNSATTAYTYDYRGDVTSVDGPRTDVDDRSYTTYDALRRKVFEISPDPDGSGPLPRPMVRHIYDIDGREARTEYGYGTATDGTDFVVQRFERMKFDPVTGDLVKKEVGHP